ncbi:sigma 54-interacting transcriptional regulator [Escherichia coli]|nr:sigma 54-interacting transcriptional regulator [Escherichia coli]
MGHILTNSPAMMDICKDTAKIALSQASVLISGESGTGKELIARAIHYNSRRAKGRSLKSTARRCRNRCSKVNCLVMKKVHLLVHKPCVRDYLNEPTKVLCSSTKLAKCRWYYKPNYYAFYRNGNLNGLAAIRP